MEFDELQHDLFQKMSPQQKLEESMSLYYSAKQLKKAWLRQSNTGWTDQQVEQAVREAFANARS